LFRSGTPAALGDGELLERFAARREIHDEAAELAFAALVARHGPMVLRVCRAALADPHDVDDAFQATFLVLAVRARSIRRRGSVASWLHGVAMRVSAAERTRTARRRRHEGLRAAMSPSTTEDRESVPVLDDDASHAIHQEIGRLPEKYRAVVVLCYFEGLTHEMAATQLGWPVGSVRSRLAWARDRLRTRLTRRGVAPVEVADIPYVAARSGPPAIVPPLLAEVTLRGALRCGMGKAALGGIASAEAVALMQGFLRATIAARSIVAVAALLIAGLVTAGAGVLAYPLPQRGGQAKQPARAIPIPQEAPAPATPKPPADEGPLIIQAEAVDPEGEPLSGVEVLVAVWYAQSSGLPRQAYERAVTDRDGRIRLEIVRERPGERASYAQVWAYRPGLTLAASPRLAADGKSPPPPVRLVLVDGAKRTIMALGPDDLPIAGLRLALRTLRNANERGVLRLPEPWDDRFTATTDAGGVATIPDLSAGLQPLTVQVLGPEIAPHVLQLTSVQGNGTLKLGRTGRLVGIVRTESGQPIAGVPLEVRVQAAGNLPEGVGDPRGNRRTTPTVTVPLDPPLLTDPQGAFLTPPSLLSGSTYRVVIRKDGFAPFASAWVTLDRERAVIPPIRLQALRGFTGEVRDRQGRPVDGARVFLPGGKPSTATDAQGRFALKEIPPGGTLLLAEKVGFRLQGWPVEAFAPGVASTFTLTRDGEVPGHAMVPLSDPIPPAESRALADRLMEPYLSAVLEKGDDVAKSVALDVLSEIDPERTLGLLDKGTFSNEGASYILRGTLIERLAQRDPARAMALVESVSPPILRITNLATMARLLPASERAKKHALLAQATALIPKVPAGFQQRLRAIDSVARGWLDLGEPDRARPLLQEGKTIYDPLPPDRAAILSRFLVTLARLEPDQAEARFRKLIGSRSYDISMCDAAVELAIDHPSEAERLFNAREQRGLDITTHSYAMRLCRRLAKIDPPRARRIAASLDGPGDRACA
jgi:RNA polymerase sigma-70 factor (ECF subfamily)